MYPPTCQCGCGGETVFISTKEGFRKYLSAHHNRVPGKNNYHKNPETKIKSSRTQSENWKKGMYRKWWEEDTSETKEKIEGIKEKLRNNVERGQKISKSLTGKPKSEESKVKLSITQKQRYEDNPDLKVKLSKLRLKWFKQKQHKKQSKLELKFLGILKEIGVEVIEQYEVNYKLFDFYSEKHNILLEVDGDFYHCNPLVHGEPKYRTQFNTIKNDIEKNNISLKFNIPLFRFWEKDINERPEWVKEELKRILSL